MPSSPNPESHASTCAHNGSQYNPDAEKKGKQRSSQDKLDKRSPSKNRNKCRISDRTKNYLASRDSHEEFKVNGGSSDEPKRSKRLHQASASKAIKETERRLKEASTNDDGKGESPSKKVKKIRMDKEGKST